MNIIRKLRFSQKKECDSLMSTFRIMFKHKLKWARSMPNAVMDNQFIYNFRNLYELNLQAKLTNYVVQIIDRSILGRFTNIRLRKLQSLMWIPDNPLLYPFSMTNYRWNSFNNNFHFNMIMLCRQNNFCSHILIIILRRPPLPLKSKVVLSR